jgi:hypothetical protein
LLSLSLQFPLDINLTRTLLQVVSQIATGPLAETRLQPEPVAEPVAETVAETVADLDRQRRSALKGAYSEMLRMYPSHYQKPSRGAFPACLEATAQQLLTAIRNNNCTQFFKRLSENIRWRLEMWLQTQSGGPAKFPAWLAAGITRHLKEWLCNGAAPEAHETDKYEVTEQPVLSLLHGLPSALHLQSGPKRTRIEVIELCLQHVWADAALMGELESWLPAGDEKEEAKVIDLQNVRADAALMGELKSWLPAGYKKEKAKVIDLLNKQPARFFRPLCHMLRFREHNKRPLFPIVPQAHEFGTSAVLHIDTSTLEKILLRHLRIEVCLPGSSLTCIANSCSTAFS